MQIKNRKIKRWLQDGNEGLAGQGINTVDELLAAAGRLLDKAYSGDIVGQCTFQGADGKYYVGNVEFVITEADPDFIRDCREELGELKPRKQR